MKTYLKGRQIHLASKLNSKWILHENICWCTNLEKDELFEFKTWFLTKHHHFKESNFEYFTFKCDSSKDPTKVRKKLWNQAWSWIRLFSLNYKLYGKSYKTSCYLHEQLLSPHQSLFLTLFTILNSIFLSPCVMVVFENSSITCLSQKKTPCAFLIHCSFVFSWSMEHKSNPPCLSFSFGTFLLSFENGTSKWYLSFGFPRVLSSLH